MPGIAHGALYNIMIPWRATSIEATGGLIIVDSRSPRAPGCPMWEDHAEARGGGEAPSLHVHGIHPGSHITPDQSNARPLGLGPGV